VQEKLFFLDYAPVIFTSGRNPVSKIGFVGRCVYVAAQLQPSADGDFELTLQDAF